MSNTRYIAKQRLVEREMLPLIWSGRVLMVIGISLMLLFTIIIRGLVSHYGLVITVLYMVGAVLLAVAGYFAAKGRKISVLLLMILIITKSERNVELFINGYMLGKMELPFSDDQFIVSFLTWWPFAAFGIYACIKAMDRWKSLRWI